MIREQVKVEKQKSYIGARFTTLYSTPPLHTRQTMQNKN